MLRFCEAATLSIKLALVCRSILSTTCRRYRKNTSVNYSNGCAT